ncbi:MAG TPA: Ig-like domain-containing protein [Acidimicrobiales bacterium]|nr:Ig-like domain-containing protein [Acidimicrobiales bacterium]
MGRSRRLGAAVLAAVVVGLGSGLISAPPAEAKKVGNPGSAFTLKVQSGFMRIKTNSFDFVDEGRQPQCSDGTNNDGNQDAAVDFSGGDPQCTSATDDSEVAAGFQPKQPIQMSGGTIDAAGNVTFPTSGVSFPPQYSWVEASAASGGLINDFVLTITITPVANFTGHLNPLTGAMDLRMQVDVHANGGPLAAACHVGPIDINSLITGTTSPPGPNTPISGIPYDPGTGRTTIVNNSFGVPGAQSCGSAFFQDLNGQINSQLGLPSDPGNNEGQFLGEFTPTRPTPGIVASFTATPSSGPAALNVAFNASASTGTGLSYQWDFTNNGSIDATGVTASTTYATAGSYTARLRVTDSDGDFAETTRLISVGPNQPPTATDQSVTTPEDTAKPVTLTGTDPEGGPLTFALDAPTAAHGTVTGTPPNVTYNPAANYNGPDSFGFKVTDNFGNTDSGVVSVTVTPTNDAPTASDVSANTTEDNATTVTLVASDIDGDTLTYSIVTPPTKGVLGPITGNTVQYTPNPNENGADSFTFRATDPSLVNSNTATASITIAAVNDAPTANSQAVSTNEDTALPITLTGSDIEGSPLTFSLLSLPTHGSITGTPPNLTYTPAGNYHGPDGFTFKVSDPSGASSAPATVDITVNSANDAPTTQDVNVSTVEDVPVSVEIIASDLDGDTLSYTPSTPTANGGTISCTDNECTYTPASGFVGTDTFSVLVDDDNGGTATSTVTVNVSAFNNATPIFDDATFIVVEDTPRNFTVGATDADGDPLSYSVLNQPSQGHVTCSTGGACTFTPASNVTATQTAVIQVSDGRGGVDNATITFITVPANDAPVVIPASIATDEDTPASATLVTTDPDGDAFTWLLKRAPFHGTASCSTAGVCTYTPAANYHGPDSFEAEVDDGHGGRVRTTIPVTVASVNDAPSAGTVSVSLNEDAPTAAFNLVGGDLDGDGVTFAAGTSTLGALSCSAGGACSFTPAANATGTNSVAYTVSDGSYTTTGAIVITLAPVNDAPTAGNVTVGTPEDTAAAVTLAGADVDSSDPITYNLTSAPAQGTVSGVAPTLTYKPAANASGTVTFGYRVTDSHGASATATVTVVVNPVDDLPVANSASVTMAEDTATAIALTGSDVEGPVTVAITAPPIHGSYVSGTYTPVANFNGADSIGFRVTDGGGQTANGVISITITPVNDPPVASGGSFATTRTTPINIVLNATDPDGDTLVWAILTGPGHGSLSGAAPNLTYTPAGLYTGPDVFTYKVTDAAGVERSATINITVSAGTTGTVLTVAPATVTKPALVGNYKYNNLSGTLKTTGGIPIPGMPIGFSVNGKLICGGTTNASGVATCSGTGPRVNSTTYLGVFSGGSGYAAATGTGTLS